MYVRMYEGIFSRHECSYCRRTSFFEWVAVVPSTSVDVTDVSSVRASSRAPPSLNGLRLCQAPPLVSPTRHRFVFHPGQYSCTSMNSWPIHELWCMYNICWDMARASCNLCLQARSIVLSFSGFSLWQWFDLLGQSMLVACLIFLGYMALCLFSWFLFFQWFVCYVDLLIVKLWMTS
jgi:hypothetical protein